VDKDAENGELADIDTACSPSVAKPLAVACKKMTRSKYAKLDESTHIANTDYSKMRDNEYSKVCLHHCHV